jgi:RNA-directed DNA polymerase
VYTALKREQLGAALAAAFLAGDWNEQALLERAQRTLEPRPRWLRGVVRDVLAFYHRPPHDRPRELARVIGFELHRLPGTSYSRPPRIRRWWLFDQRMGQMRWPVPAIATSGELEDALGLRPGSLEWLADTRGWERTAADERLRHYRYRWVARRGGVPRPIEQPKERLKELQRWILRDILDAIPPHESAHGFTPGRSARTHAAAHVGAPAVLRFDLEDFFASIEARRVYGIFRSAGYPETVAYKLTGFCTNVVPLDKWEAQPVPRGLPLVDAYARLGRRLATPHLPQGAPTSPALANLCAYRLDLRLSGLARRLDARYTRYADDLVFSGGVTLLRDWLRIERVVSEIARDEGFFLNPLKSRRMGRDGRQRVCGVVVNERTNVTRREYDELKAIVHNSARLGPATQNRAGVADFRAHLLGRISWVESLHPERGRKLRERFGAIDWG